METYLALASLRATRRYDQAPIPGEVVGRILEAGRVSGSSRNRQPWRFVVLTRDTVERLAPSVWEPANLLGSALAVAVVVTGKGPVAFDAGRAAQSMMLAAWDQGVGSCPNGIREADLAGATMGLGDDEGIATVVSFGYPAQGVDPAQRSPEEWIDRADRRPREEVITQR